MVKYGRWQLRGARTVENKTSAGWTPYSGRDLCSKVTAVILHGVVSPEYRPGTELGFSHASPSSRIGRDFSCLEQKPQAIPQPSMLGIVLGRSKAFSRTRTPPKPLPRFRDPGNSFETFGKVGFASKRKGTTSKGSRTFTGRPRPESSLDCLMCASFLR